MQPIRVDERCYRLGEQPVYLNSGEFHYFRVPKADWRERMRLFREAGGNCLGTYVPWVIHEPEEGRFVFGDPDFTDLEGFLQTAAEEGLYVLARPGPYQYSELLYAGLPHWLCERHPEILARDHAGHPLRFYSVSYLHPTFLAKARAWFGRVVPLLAKYTVSRGGPIAFTQFDNEMIGIHLWYGSPDYNAETMGFGQPEGRFPRFLRQRYGDLAALRAATGVDVTAFEKVPPPPVTGPLTAPEIRRRKDYLDCYYAAAAEYAATLAAWLREFGIDTPLVHNAGGVPTQFSEMVAALGDGFTLGIDNYYTLDQNWPQNNPTPQYARNVFVQLEMLRLWHRPPTVFELPGGSLSDWPPITPQDARACYFTNLAFGMKGHNYYIFTGGPNPPGVGNTTDVYDYGAAIGAAGEVRPLYQMQQQFGVWLRERPWLAEAERESDCRFTLDREMTRAEQYWRGRGEFLLSPPEAWNAMTKGPLTTALCAALSPVFCDLDSDEWLGDLSTPVVVSCAAAMARRRQERVVRFLQRGGKALITPVLPTVDDQLQPCTVLADFLGAGTLRGSGLAPTRLTVGDTVNVFNNGEVFFGVPPAGAAIIGREERSGQPIAWQLTTAGGGEVIFLGFQWTHAMREHEQMLCGLLGRLGLKRKVWCSNSAVWTSLRTAGQRSVLFLLNLMSAPMDAVVQCQPAWADHRLDHGLIHLPPMTVQCLELPVKS